MICMRCCIRGCEHVHICPPLYERSCICMCICERMYDHVHVRVDGSWCIYMCTSANVPVCARIGVPGRVCTNKSRSMFVYLYATA